MFQIGDWRVLIGYLSLLSDLLCKAPLIVLAQRAGPTYLLVQHGDGVQNDFTNDLIEDVIP